VLIPRDAATVMLVRDAPDLEVFLLRRNHDSVWIAGASVFPGGAIDDHDRDPSWTTRTRSWTDERASRALGVPEGGLGFFVGAIRETFEEAGVLLARDADGRLVDGGTEELHAERDALNAGRTDFAGVAARHGLVLATDELHVFSHWVTPPGGPRRYDTWFFVAAAPPGRYRHDEVELIESAWVRPAAALRAADEATIELILPTRRNLEAIARFARVADLLDAVRRGNEPNADGRIRMISEANAGRRIGLPGDITRDGTVPCPT
jgi:8-oxo-dGTP pyrophosphatase MutT (NUDIX family)